jgi:hypothetical protein
MAAIAEDERRAAERASKRGRRLEAAFLWDGVRALASFIYGPGDPRAWAALSRSARSLSESAGTAGCGNEPWLDENLPDKARRLVASGELALKAMGEFGGGSGGGEALYRVPDDVARVEFAFAAGTSKSASLGLAASSAEILAPSEAGDLEAESAALGAASFSDAPDGGEPDWDGEFDEGWRDEFELGGGGPDGSGFGGGGPGGGGPGGGGRDRNSGDGGDVNAGSTRRRPSSLSAALFPVPRPFARGLPWETPDGMRLRLAEAERPGGPGTGSREALVLRSRLGAALFDSGVPALKKEGLALLRKASDGLDAVLGPGDAAALEAKARRARRLAGLPGPGRLTQYGCSNPPMKRLLEAKALLEEALSLAEGLPGLKGAHFRLAAKMCLSGVSFGLEGPSGPFGMDEETDWWEGCAEVNAAMGPLAASGQITEITQALCFFEGAELQRRAGGGRAARQSHRNALYMRRKHRGWRHPETAQSLAFSGDLEEALEGTGAGAPFWVLALEALEGGGELFERDRADLEFRLGCSLTNSGSAREAIPVLERALARAAARLGEENWVALRSLLALSCARDSAGSPDEAAEGFEKLTELLEAERAPLSPGVAAKRYGDMLFLALSGLASILSARGDAAAADAAFSRAAKVRLPDSSPILEAAEEEAALAAVNEVAAFLLGMPPHGGGPGGGRGPG